MLKVACLTDIGRSREINEDCFAHISIKEGLDLLIVADGMGGHNAGEVASNIAVKSVSEYILKKAGKISDRDSGIAALKDAVMEANADILKKSIEDESCSGMGTTVTIALVMSDNILIAHVGDSRAYILKDRSLKKITKDHSLVAELVRNGTITEDEAQHHPQKNIITRALGIEENLQVDIEDLSISPGDTIMLCTDGLSNMLDDKEMEKILIDNCDPETAVKKLVDCANELGGYDNITVIIAQITRSDSEVEK